MRAILLFLYLTIFSLHFINGQTVQREKINRSDLLIVDSLLTNKGITDHDRYTELIISKLINTADNNISAYELKAILNFCIARFADSDTISGSLAAWLREDHSIYSGKSPSSISLFRAYLIAMMEKMKPNATIYNFVKSELLFSDQTVNVAAAANTAKLFTSNSKELVQILNTYFTRSVSTEWVDITTSAYTYPLSKPTTLKYEIIKSLPYFGEDAWPSVKYLKTIIKEEKEKTAFTKDTLLILLTENAIQLIEEQTPLCCRKEPAGDQSYAAEDVDIIAVKKRNDFLNKALQLLDQDGDRIAMKDLFGKPCVFTFFYTSCTNKLKCASTVSNLAKLQQLITQNKQQKKMLIYAMTYDPDFDKPAVLKNYGTIYGIDFKTNARFLSPVANNEQDNFKPLNLRVNYGFGSINQHGIQLYVLDKKGKIAAVYDNQLWNVNDVYNKLVQLNKE